MTITLHLLDFLQSDAAATHLHRLADADLSKANTLALLTDLRKKVTPEQAGALLETARLRRQAVDKFGDDAATMLFTRDALQQASDAQIRAYRAGLVDGAVLDVCCGIGADSLAFAQGGAVVLGLDIDALRVTIAQYNAAILGVRAQFAVADVRDGLPPGHDIIFFDPARRTDGGKRIHDVESYIPPLSLVRDWTACRVMVKLSPGVELAQLEPYGGRVEFISVQGDLKEAVLHLGDDTTGTSATLLMDGIAHHWRRDHLPDDRPTSPPRGWLLEPDAALLRAGLVADAAHAWDAYQLDSTIAYVTANDVPQSPWVRAWRVRDWLPFNLKRLRAYLRERGIGQVTVKKRGFPMTPEELINKLKLKNGEDSCVLVLTRYDGQPIVIVCDEPTPNR